MATDLSAWLASELGGRVTTTDLRTGPLLRRTSKIVAQQHGLSWECYVNAVSVWIWINSRVLGGQAGFSVNKKCPVMGFTEPLEFPFQHLPLPVFVWPAARQPEPYPAAHALAACRRLEPWFAALALGRGDYVSATPDQITIWNRRPNAACLQRRIHLVRDQFR